MLNREKVTEKVAEDESKDELEKAEKAKNRKKLRLLKQKEVRSQRVNPLNGLPDTGPDSITLHAFLERKYRPERKRKRALAEAEAKAKALNDESSASSATPVNESTALLVDKLTIAEKLNKITVMVSELSAKMNSGELQPQEIELLHQFLAQLNLFMEELILAMSQPSLEPQLENLLNLWLIRVKSLHFYVGELNLHRDDKPQAHRVLQVHQKELVQQEQQIQQVAREVQQQIDEARRQQQAYQLLQAQQAQQQMQQIARRQQQQVYQAYHQWLQARHVQQQARQAQQEQEIVENFLGSQDEGSGKRQKRS